MAELTPAEKRVRILVVDDHAATRNLVKSILKGYGYDNIAQAESGELAIKRIFEGNIDEVICDWNMPGLSGVDVLREVRADEAYQTLPFLMLTAEAYRENITQAMQLGVSDYISKPFTAEILGEKLSAVLKKSALKWNRT